MSDHSALKNDAKDQINGHEITCDPVAVLALIAEVEQLQGKKALCKLHERSECLQCMWPPPDKSEVSELKAEVEMLRSILSEARSMLNTVSECSSNECEDCREHAGLHRDGIDLVIGKSGES